MHDLRAIAITAMPIFCLLMLPAGAVGEEEITMVASIIAKKKTVNVDAAKAALQEVRENKAIE